MKLKLNRIEFRYLDARANDIIAFWTLAQPVTNGNKWNVGIYKNGEQIHRACTNSAPNQTSSLRLVNRGIELNSK